MTELFDTLPQQGEVTWIGLRQQRGTPLQVVKTCKAEVSLGLVGDHYHGKSGKREVTLIQYEHILTVASILQQNDLDPSLLRRNIVVKGINLLALKDREFQIGEAVLKYTGLCHPCSRMETNLGPGGYNAVRGHGGITAKVLETGQISLRDSVSILPSDG